MELNGIAHIQLVVNDFEKCAPFYKKLFELFHMTLLIDTPMGIYGVGGKTGLGISRADPKNRHMAFDQQRIGLHHLCFRFKSREDIDELYEALKKMEAKIIHPPEEGPWAKGYYSVLFEDPDGIRLEANHVPGKGNLDPSVKLPIKEFPGYEDYSES